MSNIKLYRCNTFDNPEPIYIKCDSYHESESFINFELDGAIILSINNTDVHSVILSSAYEMIQMK